MQERNQRIKSTDRIMGFHDRSHLGGGPVAGPPQGDKRRAVGVPPYQEPRRRSSSSAPLSEHTREYNEAAPAVKKVKKRRSHEAASWVLAIVLAVVAAFLIRAFLFEIILVEGESMQPTLVTDERIGIEKVSRYASLPERGDIIIVKYPDMDGSFVKRTIGLPGETVEVRNSTVYIDGIPLEEDYIVDAPYADMDPVVVPEDHVFVMGDNRPNSLDSRVSYIGPIPRDAILGHGLFVMWPPDNIHMIND